MVKALTATVEVRRGGQVLRLPGASLCVKDPQGTVHRAPLAERPLLVGSSPECDLVPKDPRVTRRHCSVQLSTNGLVLRDLGSKNGTFVGEVGVREVLLPVGTHATLGGSTLWVESDETVHEVPLHGAAQFGDALGACVAMRALFATLSKLATSKEPVLLVGESGTGKELLARGLHSNGRAQGPFVVVDCASLSPALAEAELFGSEAGAFTGAVARAGLFEQAHGGTLFFDGLAELAPEVQPRLLRALETMEVKRLGGAASLKVDVRVVASAQRDLRARVESGAFRRDLWFRLAVLELHVPPLRERLDDLELLVGHVLKTMDPPRGLADLPPGTVPLFRSHQWPGNVRELANAVRRLVLRGPPDAPAPSGGWRGLGLGDARRELLVAFERQYVAQALEAHHGNVSATAAALGVSRQIVHRLIARYRLKAGDGG